MMLNLFITLAAIAGAQITFYLIHQKHVSTVRASSGATLVFALLTMALSDPLVITIRAAFFGATFVGMTAKTRMGKKRVLLASLLFAVIFICLMPYLKGLGGGLGSVAFVASSAVYIFEKAFRKWQKANP